MSDSTWVPIRDAIEDGFSFAVKYIFPVVLMLTGSGAVTMPAWATTLLSKIVPALIGIAETTFPAAGSGPMKKQFVLDAAGQLLTLVGSTVTGGAALTYDKLRPDLSVLIDRTVAATNAIAPSIIANDAPEVPPPPPGN